MIASQAYVFPVGVYPKTCLKPYRAGFLKFLVQRGSFEPRVALCMQKESSCQ